MCSSDLWGTSICGGEILDPTQGLPEEAYLKHVTAKEEEAELKITFEKGEIVAVNGEKFDDKIAAIQKIEEVSRLQLLSSSSRLTACWRRAH